MNDHDLILAIQELLDGVTILTLYPSNFPKAWEKRAERRALQHYLSARGQIFAATGVLQRRRGDAWRYIEARGWRKLAGCNGATTKQAGD